MISTANKKVKEGAAKYVKGELEIEPSTPSKFVGGGRKRKATAEEVDETPTPTPKKRSPRKKAVVKREQVEGGGDSSGPGELLLWLLAEALH